MKQKTYNELDAIDLALIEQLTIDGRQTITELTKNLGISRKSTSRRMQRILDSQLVRVTALSDPRARGHWPLVTIGLKVNVGKADTVANQLATYANIRFVIISGGRYDIVAWVEFQDSDDMHGFLANELGRLTEIVSIETMVTLKLIKASMEPLLELNDNLKSKKLSSEDLLNRTIENTNKDYDDNLNGKDIPGRNNGKGHKQYSELLENSQQLLVGQASTKGV